MDEKEAAKTKLLIATLQKYGYDLEDPAHTNSSSSTNSSDSSTEWSPDDDVEPAASGTSSTGILALRDRKNQQSALHIAAKKGHIDVLRALAKLPKLSEHVNAGDRHSNTALHFAVSSNRSKAPDLVKLLLELGANPSATNVRGQTPLAIHIMTAKPDTPVTIVKLFIDKFRQLNDTSSLSSSLGPSSPSSPTRIRAAAPCAALNELVNGTTYLHMAVDRQLGEIGGTLVQGGASINVPDHNGVMVSDTIQKKQLVKLITFMAEGSQVAPPDIVRGSCKICRNPKSLLDPLKDCVLCGRAVCKNCSEKASEIRKKTSDGSYVALKDKDEGRFCAVCCTVKILKSKKHNQRENFNKKLMGCGMK